MRALRVRAVRVRAVRGPCGARWACLMRLFGTSSSPSPPCGSHIKRLQSQRSPGGSRLGPGVAGRAERVFGLFAEMADRVQGGVGDGKGVGWKKVCFLGGAREESGRGIGAGRLGPAEPGPGVVLRRI